MNAPATDKARERGTFLRVTVASSVLFAAVFCLHNVASVYSGNSDGFQFALHQVFYVTVPVFLFVSAYLMVPAFWLHGKRLRRYAFVISYLAVLAWVYSNFIVLDFGLLDGELWDFEPLSRYLYPEIAGLIGGGVALWFLLKGLPRACLYFLTILNIALAGPTAYALIADTGAHLVSRYTPAEKDSYEWRGLVGRANPLFLVKAPHARHDLRTVEGGIQPSDLAATVCAFVEGCDIGEGLSVFDVEAVPPRVRVYQHYPWSHRFWGKDVTLDIRDYTVRGPVWERDSWVDF